MNSLVEHIGKVPPCLRGECEALLHRDFGPFGDVHRMIPYPLDVSGHVVEHMQALCAKRGELAGIDPIEELPDRAIEGVDRFLGLKDGVHLSSLALQEGRAARVKHRARQLSHPE